MLLFIIIVLCIIAALGCFAPLTLRERNRISRARTQAKYDAAIAKQFRIK